MGPVQCTKGLHYPNRKMKNRKMKNLKIMRAGGLVLFLMKCSDEAADSGNEQYRSHRNELEFRNL